MSMTRVRSLPAAGRVTERPAQTPIRIPSWLLPAGLAVLLVALALYVLQIRHVALFGIDLGVYQGGAQDYLRGRNPYDYLYTSYHLAYTYPPSSFLVFAPLAALSLTNALHLMLLLGLAATFASVWLMVRMLGYTGLAGQVGISAAVTGLVTWCDPFQLTYDYGQINVLLMLLVVIDAAIPARYRTKGVLTGIAAAVKLVPAIFVVYLLLTRRFRAAAVAAGTFVALTAIAWIAVPAASASYWLHGLVLDTRRVADSPRYQSNQSLHGAALRLLYEYSGAQLVWVLLAAVVVVVGLTCATLAHRRGEDPVGLVITAGTALLVSPISWVHHWVWIAPLLVVLVHLGWRQGGRARVIAAGLSAVVVGTFFCWPFRTHPNAPLTWQSLVWTVPHSYKDPGHRYTSLIQSILGESYTLVAVVLLVVAAGWLLYRQKLPSRVAPLDQYSLQADEFAGSTSELASAPPVGVTVGRHYARV